MRCVNLLMQSQSREEWNDTDSWTTEFEAIVTDLSREASVSTLKFETEVESTYKRAII